MEGRAKGMVVWNALKRHYCLSLCPKENIKEILKNFYSKEKLKRIKTVNIWGSPCALDHQRKPKAFSFCIRENPKVISMNMPRIKMDERGAIFIPMRVLISIVVMAAIIAIAFLGLQNAIKVAAEKQVERECDELIAMLSTMVKGDARDINNPQDMQGSTRNKRV